MHTMTANDIVYYIESLAAKGERIDAKKFMVSFYGTEKLREFFGENINAIAPVYQKIITETLNRPMELNDPMLSKYEMVTIWLEGAADQINKLFGAGRWAK